MDEIVWIRASDYDPSVQPGLVFQPEPDLPAFEVIGRRRVVMMFNPGERWEIRPFTQLVLRIVHQERDGQERDRAEPVPASTLPRRRF